MKLQVNLKHKRMAFRADRVKTSKYWEPDKDWNDRIILLRFPSIFVKYVTDHEFLFWCDNQLFTEEVAGENFLGITLPIKAFYFWLEERLSKDILHSFIVPMSHHALFFLLVISLPELKEKFGDKGFHFTFKPHVLSINVEQNLYRFKLYLN